MVFVQWFQQLITPPNGKERIAIHQQIELLVDEVTKSDLEALFDPPKVAAHVYYIVGFLCEDLEENEDYVKECTIEEEAEEHMGKAEFLEQSDDE